MKLFAKLKKEIRNFKEVPKEERWGYFLDYYKWYAIIALVVIALLVQGVVGMAKQKETVYTGFVLNAKIGIDDEDFLKGFYDLTDIDTKTQQAAFYSDLILTQNGRKNDINTIQRIMASISIEDADTVISTAEGFQVCAYNTSRIFVDLREFLDEKTLEAFSGKLYYIDGAVMEALSKPVGEFVDPYAMEYPADPTKPETMNDPIPVGIDVSDREDLMDTYFLSDTTAYLGIVVNSQRQDLTRIFIDYLFP